MKNILIVLLIFASFQFSYSQSGWVWQNPLPQGNTLYAVRYLNQSTGIAVGDKGTVIKTTNGGNNWVTLKTDPNYNYHDVCWVNSMTIFCVGCFDFYNNYLGIISKTTNGGLNWIDFPQSNYYGFSSICFADDSVGYVAGDRGAVLKTTNQGFNWLNFSVNSNSYISDIGFFDQNTGIVTDGFNLYRTSNSGSSWNIVDNSNYNYSFSFIDSVNCYSIGGNYCIFTSNGGLTWVKKNYQIGAYMRSLSFHDLYNGFSCGQSRIYRTTNSANTWIISYDNPSDYLLSIDFSSSESGLSVGQNGQILKTSNSGINWNSARSNMIQNLYSGKAISENLVFAVGDSGTILRTSNGGGNWQVLKFGESKKYRSLAIVDSNFVVVVGDHGSILRTTNSGLTWATIVTGRMDDLTGISFIDNMTGWVCSSSGTLLKTTDSGLSWVNLPTGNSLPNTSIFFTSQYTGYVTSAVYESHYSAGAVLKTTNGGLNWATLINSTDGFFSVFFLNNSTGWLIENNICLEKTTNGGINWIANLCFPTDKGVTSVMFLDSLNGFASGFNNGRLNGIFLKTTNSGSNWIMYATNSDLQQYAVSFVNRNTGWIFGSSGEILKTTDGGGNLVISVNPLSSIIPESFSLSQNYPNPFNPTTKIKFDIPASHSFGDGSRVRLCIYDILGREVATLVNEQLKPGSYEAEWDGSNYASGIYFYSLQTEQFTETKKLMLIK